MKGIYWGLLLGITTSAGLWGLKGNSIIPAEDHLRLPTETVIRHHGEEDEDEERRKREEWIEQMHLTAPGTNWRQIDAETRAKKYQQYISSAKTSGDTLANGNLIGEWKERGSVNQAGRVHVAYLDTTTRTIYLGSDGGQVWKGPADGSAWTVLNDQWKFPDIKWIQILPHNGGKRIIVPAGGSKVYLSDDDGSTWFTANGLTNAANWGGIRRCIILDDAARTIYLMVLEWDYTNWNAENSLYRSTDHGTTFNKITSWDEPTYGGVDRKDIWAPVYGDTLAYLLRDSIIYSLDPSTGMPNQIASFNLTGLPGNTGQTMLCGSSQNGNTTLYAYIEQDIYRSTDGGLTWDFRGNCGMNPFYVTSFSADIDNPDIVYFGDIDTHKSTDGGQTWNQMSIWYQYYGNPANKLHADIPSIITGLDTGRTKFQFISTDGGLYKSFDQLQTVQNISLHGLNISQYYSTYTHRTQPDYIYVGTQDQGFQRCQLDSGTVLGFDQVISGDYGHIVSGSEGQSIFLNYPGFTDFYFNARFQGGVASRDFTGLNIPLWIPPLMEVPGSGVECILAGGNDNATGSHMLRLSYTGAAQLQVTEMPFDFENASGGSFISAMAYHPQETNKWYVITGNGKFFRSTDSGTTWTVTSGFNGPGNHYFYGSDILVLDDGTIFVSGSGYSGPGVYRSTNGGQSFTNVHGALPNTMIYALAANQDQTVIFAATEVGPYAYAMGENQWYDISNGQAPDQTYWCVDYIPATRTARFGTYGRGIWDFTEDPLPVALSQPGLAGSLSVYPNPAVDRVQYAGGPAGAEYRLVNAAGQVVRQWRSAASNGQFSVADYPAGVYFLQCNAGAHKITKRLVVAR